MNLDQFRSWALSQGSVAKYTDGQFKGECVSLINQGLARMHGISAGAWGHAKSWGNANNPIRQWFDQVGSPQAGDIGVDTNGEYGHIWFYLPNNQILEQNGRVARTVTVSSMRGANVILRRKGTTTPPQGGSMITNADRDPIRVISSEVKGWDMNLVHSGAYDARELAAWVGRPWRDFIMQGWGEGGAFRNKRIAAMNYYDTRRPVLEAELAAAKERIAVLESQAGTKPDERWDQLSKLAKELLK